MPVSIYSAAVILRANQAVQCRIGQLNGVRYHLNGHKSLSPLQYGAWRESSGAVATVQLSPPTNKSSQNLIIALLEIK
jgi:hypothetical protein